MLRSSQSLKYRIAAIIFTLEAVMMAFVLGATLTEYREANRLQAKGNEMVMLNLLSELSRIALFTAEYDDLQPYIELVVKDPRVDRVVLLDHQERVVVSSEVSDIGEVAPAFTEAQDQYWLTQKIQNSSGPLGTLAINFTDHALVAANRKALDTGIRIALIGMSIIAVVGVIIGFILTRRLEKLTKAAQRLAEGDLSVKVDIKGKDEVAILGQAFDQMTTNIKTYIDDLHVTQENLRHAHDELEQRIVARTKELAVARDEALEANRTKSMFLANMSHELRTPLNAIIGYSEMLEEEAAEFHYDSLVPDLQKIRDSGTHLLNLINDILDLSKIEAGKMEVSPDYFNVCDLVSAVAATVTPLAEQSHNRFEVICDANIGEMYADSMRLKQALLNLLGNAMKFTEHGKVKLTVERQQSTDRKWWVYFHVQDNGIGIADEQQKNLFSEFMQADISTTRRYGGTGLGLAISRRFCNLMGGDVRLKSELNKGSTFTIMLPLQMAELQPTLEASPITGQSVRLRGNAPMGQERRRSVSKVLILGDDEASQCDPLYRYLLRMGFDTFSSDVSEDALALMQQYQPSAVLLFARAKQSSSWVLLESLRLDTSFKQTAVVVITASEMADRAYAAGADRVLKYPADADLVIDTLRDLLRNRISVSKVIA